MNNAAENQTEIDTLTSCIQSNPKDAEAYFNRGCNYLFELENFESAISDFNHALELDSNNCNYLEFRGLAYYFSKDYQSSICDFNLIIQIDPNNARYFADRGDAFCKIGDYSSAITDYSSAINLDSNNARFFACRGDAFTEIDECLAAIADYSSAIQIDPSNASFYVGRSFPFMYLDNYNAAILDLTKSISLEGDSPSYSSYSYRGLAYFLSHNYENAISDFSKAIDLDGENAIHYKDRGDTFFSMNNFEEAIIDFSKAIERDDKNPEYYADRSRAFFSTKKYQEAISDITLALQLKPDDAHFYYRRGNLYLISHSLSEAIADYSKAIKLEPYCAEYLVSRGDAYAFLYNTNDAISDYSNAISIVDNVPTFYYKRGLAYITNDNFTEAISDFNRAIDLDNRNAKFFLERGRAYFFNNNYESSIQDLKSSIFLNPQSAKANFYLIYFMFLNKKFEDVISAFNSARVNLPTIAENENYWVSIAIIACNSYISLRKRNLATGIVSFILSYYANSVKLQSYIIKNNFLFKIDSAILEKVVNNPFFLAATQFLQTKTRQKSTINLLLKNVYKLWNKLHIVEHKDNQMLYQYTSIDVLSSMLDHGTLRLTPVDYLNDPLEGKILKKYLSNQYVMDLFRNACSLTNEDFIKLNWNSIIDSIFDVDDYNDIVVFSRSLTKHDDSLLMWNSSYGQNGSGIAIGIPSNLFSKGIGYDNMSLVKTSSLPKNVSAKMNKDNCLDRIDNEPRNFGLYQVLYISSSLSDDDNAFPALDNKNFYKLINAIGIALLKLIKVEKPEVLSNSYYIQGLSSLLTPIQFLIKDICFAHENEFRIVYISKLSPQNSLINSDFKNGLFVETEKILFSENFSTEVITGPLISFSEAQKYRHLIMMKQGKNRFRMSTIKFQ